MRRTFLLFLVLACLLTAIPPASADQPPTVYNPSETAAQRTARLAWWHEAKFGLFLHFGIYAIAGKGEWNMRNSRIPIAEYAKFAAEFNPTKFNADQWAQIAHDAGMKYMVITSKHHDGFAMFKSEASSYNVVDATPFHRDVIKELSEACPRHEVRFGVYYSALSDWGHPGGGIGCPPWDPAQKGDRDTYLQTIAQPQVHELLTHYGPISEFWFDTDGATPMTPAQAAPFYQLLKLQPQVIIDDRLTGGGDFWTAEQRVPALPPGNDWEACETINGGWGYSPTPSKPYPDLLRKLIDIVSKGGNLLLNVGPQPDGQLPADAVDRLEKMGAWLRVNGESIYGTTTGPFDFLSYGRSTRKGDMLYLQVFDWPVDGILHVPLSNAITSAYLLSDPAKTPLKFESVAGKLLLHVPQNAPDPVASVVALQVQGEPSPVHSLALNKPVETVQAGGNSGQFAVDDNPGTYWEPTGSSVQLQVDLQTPQPISSVRIRFNSYSGTVPKFSLEYQDGDQWKTIFEDKNLPDDIYVKTFPAVTARKVRLNLLEAQGHLSITSFELFSPE
jgi:alpha-L-fucosidase